MFLLVPAHPGFPGQIPQSRKTVVCVCVYEICVLFMLIIFIFLMFTMKNVHVCGLFPSMHQDY